MLVMELSDKKNSRTVSDFIYTKFLFLFHFAVSHLESLKHEQDELQILLQNQKFTPADVERINREKRELQQTISTLNKSLEDAEQHKWNEEIALAKLKEKVPYVYVVCKQRGVDSWAGRDRCYSLIESFCSSLSSLILTNSRKTTWIWKYSWMQCMQHHITQSLLKPKWVVKIKKCKFCNIYLIWLFFKCFLLIWLTVFVDGLYHMFFIQWHLFLLCLCLTDICTVSPSILGRVEVSRVS